MSNEQQRPRALSDEWVGVIFDKCTVTYGRRFMAQWDDLDADRVRADWAHELAGFAQHPRGIAYALQNLPADLPLNVMQFRAIARRAPAEDLPALECPPARREARAGALAAVAHYAAEERPANREWARVIVARKAAGESITPTVLRMAEDALHLERDGDRAP